MRESFWRWVLPLTQIDIVLTVLKAPLFWIASATAVTGLLGYIGLSKLAEEQSHPDSSRDGRGSEGDPPPERGD